MQHARFYVGLMIVSMILPSSPLKAGSFDTLKNQSTDADHESTLLSQESGTPEPLEDVNKDKNLLPDAKPDFEILAKNSAAQVLEKYIAKDTANKHSNATIALTNKANSEYESALKTSQVSLAAMHEIAVKNQNTEIAIALFQEMSEEKRKKHFYDNLTTREKVCIGAGFTSASAVALLINCRGAILGGIQLLAGKIAGNQGK